mmetsp:Transcript_27320/g.62968  ORF Transcript_27320/g.62968 Transcript_27320/m.62968 type:complete len:236 (-) Transcript_27320:72-779(-)
MQHPLHLGTIQVLQQAILHSQAIHQHNHRCIHLILGSRLPGRHLPTILLGKLHLVLPHNQCKHCLLQTTTVRKHEGLLHLLRIPMPLTLHATLMVLQQRRQLHVRHHLVAQMQALGEIHMHLVVTIGMVMMAEKRVHQKSIGGEPTSMHHQVLVLLHSLLQVHRLSTARATTHTTEGHHLPAEVLHQRLHNLVRQPLQDTIPAQEEIVARQWIRMGGLQRVIAQPVIDINLIDAL